MKKPISATIEESLIRWLDKKIKEDSRFRNKSHLIESAIELMKKKEVEDGSI